MNVFVFKKSLASFAVASMSLGKQGDEDLLLRVEVLPTVTILRFKTLNSLIGVSIIMVTVPTMYELLLNCMESYGLQAKRCTSTASQAEIDQPAQFMPFCATSLMSQRTTLGI